jgi:phage shock protein C
MNRFRNRTGRGLYRSRDGVVLGVCRGLADYLDFSLFWLRTFVVIVMFLSGLWPMLGIYILAALLMRPEPVQPIENEEEQEFYDSYVDSRRRAAQRLKWRYQNLERRIGRLEDSVTSREFDWDRRMQGR